MAQITDGILIHTLVNQNFISNIEHGAMELEKINAIVLHQTDSFSAKSTMDAWKTKKSGAHFIVDRGDTGYKGDDGKIYQTAHINKVCWHVGDIQSKCLINNACAIPKGAKKSPEAIANATKGSRARADAINKVEKAKSYPNRYPINSDSIGIEIVTKADNDGIYVAPSAAQMWAVGWLVSEISAALPQIQLPANKTDANGDIYEHGVFGRKMPTEGTGVTTIFSESAAVASIIYPILNFWGGLTTPSK